MNINSSNVLPLSSRLLSSRSDYSLQSLLSLSLSLQLSAPSPSTTLASSCSFCVSTLLSRRKVTYNFYITPAVDRIQRYLLALSTWDCRLETRPKAFRLLSPFLISRTTFVFLARFSARFLLFHSAFSAISLRWSCTHGHSRSTKSIYRGGLFTQMHLTIWWWFVISPPPSKCSLSLSLSFNFLPYISAPLLF